MDVVIGLGSNLGDRETAIAEAVDRLRGLGRVVSVSPIYETPPVGPPQPDYLNAAARLETALEPQELLRELLAIERAAGRERRERWGPRPLDLDVLWIDGVAIESAELRVPHPELEHRAFALAPLLDVAPDATDPRTGKAYRDVFVALKAEPLRRWQASLQQR